MGEKALTVANGPPSRSGPINTFTLASADYQRQHEPILYGGKHGANHYWCGAPNQGAAWFVDKPHKNDLHPTMKPVALIESAIRNSSKKPRQRAGSLWRLRDHDDRLLKHRAPGSPH